VVPPGQFATAFYGVYDSRAGQITCASGGHPAPLLLRAEGGEHEWVTEGGMVLGTLEEARWDEVSIDVQPGDKLVIYTDGVLDAADGSGSRFGPERLAAAGRAAEGTRGPQFLKAVIDSIDGFCAGSRATDDMTIVLAEAVSDGGDARRWLELQSHP
jgi:sigma-B regulation protein RsbU (phosphoserine phosphatase)